MSEIYEWSDGIYKQVFNGKVGSIVTIKGEHVTFDLIAKDDPEEIRVAKKVDLKETDKKIFDLTGKESYDLCMTNPENPEDEMYGVVSDDSRMITFKTKYGIVFTLELIDEA